MKAKYFRKKQNYPYNYFTKLTSTGVSPNYDNIEEYAEDYHQFKVENLGIFSVINWVAITERPKDQWGDYIVCLENNAIFKANYSRIGAERWLIVGVGEITSNNPVRYWAEMPEPSCL